MASEASFLSAIAESPDDPAHRLVYADWLDEHGEEERAAYLRLRTQEGRLDEHWSVERPLLKARADRFWNAHFDAWEARCRKAFGKDPNRFFFERGLPEIADVRNPAAAIKNAARGFAAPLVGVKATIEDAKQAALLKLPQLAGITELHLEQVTEAAANALAAADLPRLRKLKLDCFVCGPPALEALWRSPIMGRLTDLDIRDWGEASNGLLLARGRPPALKRLTLRHAILRGDAPAALVSADWSGLDELHLEYANLERGTEEIYASRHLGCLRAFSTTGTSNAHNAALLSNLAFRRLEKLHLDGLASGRSADMLAALAEVDWPALRYLWLKGNPLAALGAALARAPVSRRLVGLDIEDMYLKKTGVTALAGGDFAALRWLSLESSEMGDDGLKALLAAGWVKDLHHLGLSSAGLTPRGAKLLGAGSFPGLVSLDLSSNERLSEKGVSAVVSSSAFPALKALDLSYTNMTDACIGALAAGPLARQLEVLKMGVNEGSLSEDAPLELEGAMPELQSICWDVDGIDDDPDRQGQITEALGEGVFDFNPPYDD